MAEPDHLLIDAVPLGWTMYLHCPVCMEKLWGCGHWHDKWERAEECGRQYHDEVLARHRGKCRG